MQNLVIALNAVAPMFLLMAAGWGCRRRGMMTEHALSKMNGIIYRLFLPVMIIDNLYTSEIELHTAGLLVVFCCGGVLLEYVLSYFLVPKLDADPRRHAVLMQSFFRSNLITMGIVLASNIYDDVTIMCVVFAFVIPLYNVLASMAFEHDRGGRGNPVAVVLRNPLVIGTLIGVLLSFLDISWPQFVTGTVHTMGTMGSGMVVFLLGSSFDLKRAGSDRRIIAVSTVSRLVLLPAVFLAAAAALGFRDQSLFAVLIVFGSPVPAATYTMAREFQADEQLASSTVIFCNLFSCLTLFLWIFLLKSLGLV